MPEEVLSDNRARIIVVLHRANTATCHYADARSWRGPLRVLLIKTPAEMFDAWLAPVEMINGLAIQVLR